MKKNLSIKGTLFFITLATTLGLNAQTVTLKFTGRGSDNSYIRLNKVVINNLTKSWQETIWWPDTTLTMQNGTGIDDYAENSGFSLSQNNPNPFSGTTEVSLNVVEEGQVHLIIADMNGREIVEMQNFSSLQPGLHQFRLSLSTVGTYVMTARQNGKTSSIKMICNGGGGTNDIDYLGETQSITYTLKSTTNKPFNYGDMMEYIGYATFNGSQMESQHITQAQGTSQTFTLQFAVAQSPDAPTGVSATVSGSRIYVSWNSVSNATSYKVYRSSSASGSYTLIGSPSSTYYYDNSPLTGYNYYKIKAVNSAGESSYSSYASCNYTGGTTAPNAPTGVSVTNTGTSSSPQLKISWNSVSNATSYKVYRSSSASGTYSQIGSATSNTYLYDNSPMSGYNYYKVKAVNSAGESSYSSYAYYNNVTAPSAPTGVTATASGTHVEISWNPVSNATSYKVYRSSSASGTYSQIGSATSNTYLYDNNPLSGYNYYKVKAVNSAGESAYSSYAYYNNVTAPSAPTGVTATASGTHVEISWNPVSNATSYKVYRSSSASGTYSQIGSATSNTYLYDNNPLSGYNYYKVKAVNSAGESAYSSYAYCNNSGGGTTYSPCPPTVSVSGTSSQTVSWTPVTNSACGAPTSYEVYKYVPCSEGSSWELKTTTTSHSYYCSSSNVHPGINRYAVKAINSSGNAVNYATSSSVSLATPSSFSVQKLSGDYLKFTWSAVPKATGYQIFYSSTATGTYYILDQINDATTTTFTRYYPASSGTTMYFKIRAIYYCEDDAVFIDSNYSSYQVVHF